MRSPARGRLLWRLLAVQVLLVVAALGAAWLAVETRAADSFMALMKEFGIETAEVEGMFRSSTRTALAGVGVVAIAVAFALSWWITRRILRPLEQLTEGSERLAAGEHGYRIEERGGRGDELGALVRSFNRMAEALERNENVRRAMVVDVAHELRTPLTNLRGTVEALQDGLLEATPETLAALHEELMRLERLTEELVAAGRAACGGTAPRTLEPSDLRALVERTVDTFQARLLRRRLTVDLSFGEDVCRAAVDSDQMVQVFANLLQNALQFAPEGSTIRISGECAEGEVRIAFRNEGVTIPESDRELVFEPYYRVDRSRSRDGGGGAGLGLAIVRGLVGAHGGQVGARSEGDSTCVWVSLPADPN